MASDCGSRRQDRRERLLVTATTDAGVCCAGSAGCEFKCRQIDLKAFIF